jgi:hypothetical protein
MASSIKRANFDLSPEQDELLVHLRALLSASSVKDAVLRAAQLTTVLLQEMQHGNRLWLILGFEDVVESKLLLPSTYLQCAV